MLENLSWGQLLNEHRDSTPVSDVSLISYENSPEDKNNRLQLAFSEKENDKNPRGIFINCINDRN